MRGKVSFHSEIGAESGITPAHAGKSTNKDIKFGFGRDHPRACGEKPTFEPATVMTLGSPPRMRGKVGYAQLCACSLGITPAHAGKRLKK